MRAIKVTDLKAGMMFDKPVYIEGNNILAPPEIPIKEKDIQRLIRWEIQEVQTEGNIINPFTLKETAKETAENIKNKQILEFYTTAINNISEIYRNIQSNAFSEFYKGIIDAIASEFYVNIKKYDKLLIQKILATRLNQTNLAVTAVHCAILAAIIGQAFYKTKAEMLELIIATLLHDMGMSQIPEQVLLKKDKLNPDDLKTIHSHTDASYTIIKRLGYPEQVANIALHHHEKWNGKGYPGKMRNEEIPLGSRIIAVTDTYIALVNNRPYRSSMIGYNAMKAILSDNGTHFDPEILKVFLKYIGIYPVGSIVWLSDHSVGKIIGINSNSPLRPRLKLIRDKMNKRVENGIEIDLLLHKDLFIIKAIDPKQLDVV